MHYIASPKLWYSLLFLFSCQKAPLLSCMTFIQTVVASATVLWSHTTATNCQSFIILAISCLWIINAMFSRMRKINLDMYIICISFTRLWKEGRVEFLTLNINLDIYINEQENFNVLNCNLPAYTLSLKLASKIWTIIFQWIVIGVLYVITCQWILSILSPLTFFLFSSRQDFCLCNFNSTPPPLIPLIKVIFKPKLP